ncbi:MAG: c-type cytochrome [Bryobacterales bacterium]|nr:c-type cytochrome [Bryobacterales bacterium]
MMTLRAGVFVWLAVVLGAQVPKYGVGRAVSAEEIRNYGVMVGADGKGLPVGSGTAVEGKAVYAAKCERCHGAKGEGGIGSALVGGQGTLATAKPLKTVGSYWPYATTVWDYVHRAMPFDRSGTLKYDEVYSVVAYVLFLNGIVEEKQVMNASTLPKVRMPNRDGFVRDPRPDVGGSGSPR